MKASVRLFVCLFAFLLMRKSSLPGSGLAAHASDAISRSLSHLKRLTAIKEANKGLIRGAQGISDD